MKILRFVFLSTIIFIQAASCSFNENKKINSTADTILPTSNPTQTAGDYEIWDILSSDESISLNPSQSVSTSEPSPTPVKQSGSLAVIIRSGGQIFLMDENLVPISQIPDNYMAISVSPDGCYLRGINFRGNPSGFTISKLNNLGEMIYQSMALSTDVVDPIMVYDIKASPNGEWLAYKKNSGVIEYDYKSDDIQDIFLLRVDEETPQKAVQLTQNQGTKPSHLYWSMDGQKLAFTDKDPDGIDQVYVYIPDEAKRIQLTQFGSDYQNFHILDLKWSPDSSSLGFSIGWQQEIDQGTKFRKGAIGIVRLSDLKMEWIDLVKFNDFKSDLLWWGNDSQNLLLLIEETSDWSANPHIVWYSLIEKKIIHEISKDQIPNNHVPYYVIPIIDIRHVAIFAKDLYSYDQKEETWHQVKNIYNNYDFLPIFFPDAPVDLSNCKN